MVTCSSILTWRIPWTEETRGLHPVGVAKSSTQLSDQHTHRFVVLNQSDQSPVFLQPGQQKQLPLESKEFRQWGGSSCALWSTCPPVWSHSCPEAGRIVRSHFGTVSLSKLWDYTDFSVNVAMIFFRMRGNRCMIFIFYNAQNRHVFVDLASVPILLYATAKQL